MDWDVIDLGTLEYAAAWERQRERNRAVSVGEARPALLLVEHPPVITVSRRRGVRDHLLVSPAELERRGIDVQETDRGGDITYHGPGQLVAYPIVRLTDHGLNLGGYMRLLERAVVTSVAGFGVEGTTERGATGVWVEGGGGDASGGDLSGPNPIAHCPLPRPAKLCALGVRIRKHTTMHGLALNVTTDLSHFETIDPCGLGGRPVTSLSALLGAACPSMGEVRRELTACLARRLDAATAARRGGAEVPGAA
ncbi:MAG: lipoyl(octanoyl) transferase LipB [Planctomycetota bacterium]